MDLTTAPAPRCTERAGELGGLRVDRDLLTSDVEEERASRAREVRPPSLLRAREHVTASEPLHDLRLRERLAGCRQLVPGREPRGKRGEEAIDRFVAEVHRANGIADAREQRR